jgi:hypothetical protein
MGMCIELYKLSSTTGIYLYVGSFFARLDIDERKGIQKKEKKKKEKKRKKKNYIYIYIIIKKDPNSLIERKVRAIPFGPTFNPRELEEKFN